MSALKKACGFTLVELVVVIVLLGIISVGSVGFITNSVQGYADLSRRDRLSSTVRVAAEQLGREIRNALPNSVRHTDDGRCLEFIPIVQAGRYLSIPHTSEGATIQVLSQPSSLPDSPVNLYAAVYPLESNRGDGSSADNPIYDNAVGVGDSYSWSIISPAITSRVVSGGVDTLALNIPTSGDGSAGHRFPAESPTQRVFLVSQPISYCLDGANLYRYQQYGFVMSQRSPTTTPALPTADGQRWLLASGLTEPTGNLFRYKEATLQRNAMVLVDLYVQDVESGEEVRLQHEIHIRNAP